jgi:hypothetical protein
VEVEDRLGQGHSVLMQRSDPAAPTSSTPTRTAVRSRIGGVAPGSADARLGVVRALHLELPARSKPSLYIYVRGRRAATIERARAAENRLAPSWAVPQSRRLPSTRSGGSGAGRPRRRRPRRRARPAGRPSSGLRPAARRCPESLRPWARTCPTSRGTRRAARLAPRRPLDRRATLGAPCPRS